MTSSREVSLFLVLVLLCAIISTQSDSFLTFKNISEMLKNNAVTMLMALGMLCVLLIGGIDISIASTASFAGMTMAVLKKYSIVENTFVLLMIALVIGAICGLIVGLIVAKGKVLPIIATLGTMYIYRGGAYLIANDQWTSAADLGAFSNFALNTIGGISQVVWVVAGIYVIFYIVMRWTKFGRRIYAVGSNKEAAEVSGIHVDNVVISVYTIMGLLSGLGGGLSVSVYASGMPNMMYGDEMDVIAACVIGGVSMDGGRGTVVGAFLGALILAVISKALPLVGIDSIAQNTVKGAIILIVVVLNLVAQRSMIQNNLKRREL
ncbi:MAG: ABC transporter permease [Eubacteriales bacterium]